jgi:hypothetical protein
MLLLVMVLIFVVIKIKKQIVIDQDKISNTFPKKIHQTFKIKHLHANDLFAKTRMQNITNNKKWDFYLYDHDDIDFIIKSNFDTNIYHAYLKIEPIHGSVLSDFFRMCILYLYGGIYIDFKSCVYNLDLLLEYVKSIGEKDIMIVGNWENPMWTDIFPGNGEIRSSIIISTPKHPLIYECILRMVNNINNYNDNEYRNMKILKVLNLCGPHMLTRFVLENPEIMINNELIKKIYTFQCFDYKSYYKTKNIKHWHSMTDLPLIRKNVPVPITYKKNMVIVTNILHINNKEKSIYSVNERFKQLLNTLTSIFNKIPNPYVVILEGSFFTEHQKNELQTQFPVYIITHDITHLSKQYGELALLKNFLNVFVDSDFQKKFDTFHKISGRYYLNDKFICMNSFAYKLHYINYFVYKKGRIETRYYRFPSQYMHTFYEKMNSIDKINTDIEFTFYSKKVFPVDYYPQDKLHIEGLIAPTGQFVSE